MGVSGQRHVPAALYALGKMAYNKTPYISVLDRLIVAQMTKNISSVMEQ
jgi:hypothetical protein